MYDAIVVGARCAGSPTAMLLARQGHRVLLLERAAFPAIRSVITLSSIPGSCSCTAGVSCRRCLHRTARRSAPSRPTSVISRYAGRSSKETVSTRPSRRAASCWTSSSLMRPWPRGRSCGSGSLSMSCSGTATESSASAGVQAAARWSTSTPASSSAPMALTRSWPRRCKARYHEHPALTYSPRPAAAPRPPGRPGLGKPDAAAPRLRHLVGPGQGPPRVGVHRR